MDSDVDNEPGRCKFIIILLSLYHILPVPVIDSWKTAAPGGVLGRGLQVLKAPSREPATNTDKGTRRWLCL